MKEGKIEKKSQLSDTGNWTANQLFWPLDYVGWHFDVFQSMDDIIIFPLWRLFESKKHVNLGSHLIKAALEIQQTPVRDLCSSLDSFWNNVSVQMNLKQLGCFLFRLRSSRGNWIRPFASIWITSCKKKRAKTAVYFRSRSWVNTAPWFAYLKLSTWKQWNLRVRIISIDNWFATIHWSYVSESLVNQMQAEAQLIFTISVSINSFSWVRCNRLRTVQKVEMVTKTWPFGRSLAMETATLDDWIVWLLLTHGVRQPAGRSCWPGVWRRHQITTSPWRSMQSYSWFPDRTSDCQGTFNGNLVPSK
jgi:hypothetical protein